MFTSKKAQYLNGKFEKISPITNIDTLYYEQVINDGNNNFHVERKTVVKNMPIWFKTPENNEMIEKKGITYNSSLFDSDSSILFNTNIKKYDIKNPQDNTSHIYRYDSSLYEICSSTYINLHNILINYEPIGELNIANASINTEISYRNSSIDNLVSSCKDVSNLIEDLSTRIHNNEQIISHDPIELQNDIFLGKYPDPTGVNPYYWVPVKLQNALIQPQDPQNQTNRIDIISLNEANSYDWWKRTQGYTWLDFNYLPINTGEILYLYDSYYNEGNFDFANPINFINEGIERQHKLYSDYIQFGAITYNKIYINDENRKTICIHGKSIDNEIYNSSYIQFETGCNSNIIINSNGVNIEHDKHNNTIINSSNSYIANGDNIDGIDSSIIINGNNNTIINCENCDILIDGDNNFIANLKNNKLHLDSNNIIIGDTSVNFPFGDLRNLHKFSNNRLFLGDSINMTYQNDLSTNCTIFGSNTNKVNVYVNSINTTNK